MTGLLLALLLGFGQAEGPEWLSQQALELAQQNRLKEAEGLWKQALELDPEFFPALFNLGRLCHSQARFAEARSYLRRAAQARPRDFSSRYLLGAALARLGQSEEALRQWRAALALEPANVKLMQIMAVEYGKGRYFQEAAAIALRALDLSREDPNSYFLAIKACQDAGDHDTALKVAGQAVGKFPELARANFEYGFELHRAGQPQKALPYLKKAMQAAPDYEEPFLFYGEALVKEGRYEEALPYLRRAIELRRDYMAAWMALGRALMGLRRYREAAQEMRRAAEIDPDHPQPHLLLSQIYFRLGDEEAARKEKELSLKFRRENPTAMEAPQGRAFPDQP